MKRRVSGKIVFVSGLFGLLGAAALLCGVAAHSEEPAGPKPSAAAGEGGATSAGKVAVGDLQSPKVVAAREQAKLMHSIYAVTLDVIHERYFRNDRSTVPARALEDVFEEISRQRNIQARWIGVNARIMSIPHEPKDAFERNAAQAIREGKGDFEAVEAGFYRRAEAIPLSAGCLSCHGTFGVEPKTPRFAGLTLRIPLAK